MRVYIDTSVFGGYFEPEFEVWTRPFFKSIRKNVISPIVSELTVNELEEAPDRVRHLFKEHIPKIKIVQLGDEVYHLANLYIKEKAVTPKSYDDAVHIAVATIIKADVIVSWNFKHIVNVNRIRSYNSANLKYGYSVIDIRTPLEFIS
ncbi:MAG: PIN domain-containing protein [Bacteroidetes bacterium]|nr:MAG: PIN domain-containing protein [Bacteroidota bacterium]